MSKIEGVAKKFDGTAIDYVSIFNWVDGTCMAQVVPDANGVWSSQYYTQQDIGVTYVADGCEPITHGPYHLIFEGAKWWRVSNIKIRTYDHRFRNGQVAELRFNTVSGAISNDPLKGFQAHTDGSVAANAFDNNPQTIAYSNYYNLGFGIDTWWIAYEFENPEIVTSISAQMRQDMKEEWGQEWQTADIEVSDDGVNWFKFGRIEPRIPALEKSVVTTPIIK